MNDKVKVTLQQAVDFAAAGFKIECYVLPDATQSPQRRFALESRRIKRKRKGPQIQPSDTLALSFDGKAPSEHSNIGSAWVAVKDELFSHDVTETYTAAEIKAGMIAHGARNPSSILAQLVNHHGVLRRVDK